jgi:hypothetical protein
MQNKSGFAIAIATGVTIALLTTPAAARKAQKSEETNSYQLQSASSPYSSYALAPQPILNISRYGRCWVATDESRPYGYSASCANPLTRDPGLDPFYNPEW